MQFKTIQGNYKGRVDTTDLEGHSERYDRLYKHVKEPGDFMWELRPGKDEDVILWFIPPYENSMHTRIPVTTDKDKADKSGQRGTFWHWDGNYIEPFLDPSLGIYKETNEFHWHGYLKHGIFKACE